jgi:GMP synthase (glutamine-hydrolysing)
VTGESWRRLSSLLPGQAGKPAPREAIAILDFGSQYSQLIARRVREAHVYCELFRWDAPPDRVLTLSPRGFILSGGPASVYDPGAPTLPVYVLESDLPVLGICYGMQLLAHTLGGRVAPTAEREYGPAQLDKLDPNCSLFAGLSSPLDVWMSHGDRVEALPPGFVTVARTADSPVAAMADEARQRYGLQFHPEVTHTPRGPDILANFLYRTCDLHGTWTPGTFVQEAVARIQAQVGGGHVLCAVSGGVDSTVTAMLAARAIGDRLMCVFVDHGLLRRDEARQVLDVLNRHLPAEIIAIDARERFLTALAGVEDPEAKRRIIGETFVRVFEEEARRLRTRDAHLAFLAQGTLYPDVIESSAADTRAADRIKTHHNVGGLPADMDFELLEPLRYLFKDEVRAVGLKLGLPEDVVWRHPFPGPGLAVRILGPVTPDRIATLQAADAIVLEELRAADWYRRVAQAFAVLLPVRSVGVMGDGRSYAHVVAVRVVTSEDFMTADWARLPHDMLARVSSRIVGEVPGVNRVVYDISSKPPATIEWE